MTDPLDIAEGKTCPTCHAPVRDNGLYYNDTLISETARAQDLQRRLKEAEKERDDLKHDIERHLNILSENNARIAELEAALEPAHRLLSSYRASLGSKPDMITLEVDNAIERAHQALNREKPDA